MKFINNAANQSTDGLVLALLSYPNSVSTQTRAVGSWTDAFWQSSGLAGSACCPDHSDQAGTPSLASCQTGQWPTHSQAGHLSIKQSCKEYMAHPLTGQTPVNQTVMHEIRSPPTHRPDTCQSNSHASMVLIRTNELVWQRKQWGKWWAFVNATKKMI